MNKTDFVNGRRRTQPPFFRAVVADARMFLAYRAEATEVTSPLKLVGHILRLSWVTDSFLALVLYRAKARLQSLRVPIIPTIFHRLSMMFAQICIGSPVHIEPGVYIPHGQVVIDGITQIRSGAVIAPWVTIGLRAGDFTGPTIGHGVNIGTGAKIIGPVVVGDTASIGANSVVVKNVEPGSTVVGVPARPIDK